MDLLENEAMEQNLFIAIFGSIVPVVLQHEKMYQ